MPGGGGGYYTPAPAGTGLYTPVQYYTPAPAGAGLFSPSNIGGGAAGNAGADAQAQQQINANLSQIQSNLGSSLKEVEQSEISKDQLLKNMTKEQIQKSAYAADQAQLASSLGISPNAVTSEMIESGKSFREKRAEQVERGAKGTDVIYREGVKSPVYSEQFQKSEQTIASKPQPIASQAGNVAFGGYSSTGGYEVNLVSSPSLMSPAPSQYGYSTYYKPEVGKREAVLSSPIAQTQMAGQGMEVPFYFKTQTIEAAPQQEERKSIFNFGEQREQYGNRMFREYASNITGYAAERLTDLSTVMFPALKYVPTKTELPFIGEVSPRTLASGAASGAILISPFGLGEGVSTSISGKSEQKIALYSEVASIYAFGAVGGKIFGFEKPGKIQTTGFMGEVKVEPKVETSQKFRVMESPTGYKIQSSTIAKESDVILVSGKPVETIATGETRLVTTQTPYSDLSGRYFVTQTIKEVTPVTGASRITAGREAVPIIENAPQRMIGVREAEIFQRVPESGIFTPSYITRMGTRKTAEGVEVSIFRGQEQIGGGLVSKEGSQVAFGMTQKGQELFAFDEFGRMVGTSEIPIGQPKADIKFIPAYKEVPKGELFGMTVEKIVPAKTPQPMPFPENIKLESGGQGSFFKSYTPPNAPYKMSEITPKGGQSQLQYNPASYDKPVSLRDISEATSMTRSILPTGKIVEVGGKEINLLKFAPTQENVIGGIDMQKFAPITKTKYDTMQGLKQDVWQGTKTMTMQGIKYDTMQGLKQDVWQGTKTMTMQVTRQSTITQLTQPQYTPSYPIQTKIPEQPQWKPGGGGENPFGGGTSGSFTSQLGKRMKGKYQPSFTAIQFNIRGKISKGAAETGLAIRPIGGIKRGK